MIIGLLDAESGLITRWLVRLVIFLSLGGLFVIEVGGILFAKGSASAAAQTAATEAAYTMRNGSESVEAAAQAEAARVAEEKQCELTAFSLDPATQKVRVEVKREAKTFLVHRIEPLEKYTVATATHSSSYANR